MEKYIKNKGEGFYIRPYTDIKQLFITRQLYLGIHDNISNYQEVTEEEGNNLKQQRDNAIAEFINQNKE